MVQAESSEVKVELSVPAGEMDHYWANGWRHFGPIFYRYQSAVQDEHIFHVQPLRVVLGQFCPSKSQRRVLRRNVDLQVRTGPTVINADLRRLFDAHKTRFTQNVPDSLEELLGPMPSEMPCENVELSVWKDGRRLAASFLDLGTEGVSSVYAIFDPRESRRSLGIFTMLLEIDLARTRGCKYYYPGYAYREPSCYDYKLRFNGLERFDWGGHWVAIERDT